MLLYGSTVRWFSQRLGKKNTAGTDLAKLDGNRGVTEMLPYNSTAAAIINVFDDDSYIFLAEAKATGVRPVDHYVELGEARGARPNKEFDPGYYARQNPDVVATKCNLFWHYVTFGRAEGRPGKGLDLQQLPLPTVCLDETKGTVFVLVHEATKTGAPILGWNICKELSKTRNVIALIMNDGPLQTSFDSVTCATVKIPAVSLADSKDSGYLADKLISDYKPTYVIANSTATRSLAISFEKAGVPVVALVHEFASDVRPAGALNDLYRIASRIVFPTRIVAEESQEIYTILRGRAVVTHPQGPSMIPPANIAEGEVRSSKKFQKDHRFTVFGMGTITFRKGVDLFVSTADFLQRELKVTDIRFVWIGHYIPSDLPYKNAVAAQVRKCGLSEIVEFIDEVDDLEPFFEAADLYFLSSRIDPLPNVAIDAALRGVPIVCFDDASGFADILMQSDDTKHLIAPFASVDNAAKIIAGVKCDVGKYEQISKTLKAKAHELFDLKSYVKMVDDLGMSAATELRDMRVAANIIQAAAVFDAEFCYGAEGKGIEQSEAIDRYLNGVRLSWPLARPFTGTFIRRPMVGFNPLIYDLLNPPPPGVYRDPLADYIARDMIAGPWCHPVVRPSQIMGSIGIRAALHSHFHYPELIPEFLKSLSANDLKPDLFISTTSENQIKEVRALLVENGWSAKAVWIAPNRGRDIIPFLRDMPKYLKGNYDIVGHLHGKKSTHVDLSIGGRWRNFTWQHLVGDAHPMMDVIAEAFARDDRLGLVFPEDPHLNGWDFNVAIANDLAQRMDIDLPLPTHFDFPIGTMFWARPEALQPLFDLELNDDEIPPEPLAIDGTILHALERLVPFAVQKSGYTYATSHVPGITR